MRNVISTCMNFLIKKSKKIIIRKRLTCYQVQLVVHALSIRGGRYWVNWCVSSFSDCAPSASFYIRLVDDVGSYLEGFRLSGFLCRSCGRQFSLLDIGCHNCTFWTSGLYVQDDICKACPAGVYTYCFCHEDHYIELHLWSVNLKSISLVNNGNLPLQKSLVMTSLNFGTTSVFFCAFVVDLNKIFKTQLGNLPLLFCLTLSKQAQ